MMNPHTSKIVFCLALFMLGCDSTPKDQSVASSQFTGSETSPTTPQGDPPKITFQDKSFNFGEIWHGEKVEHDFEFVNEGEGDLMIEGVKASCGCTKPSYPTKAIPAGGQASIAVTYNSVGKQGFQRATIRVRTNDPNQPEVLLKLKGRVKVKPKAEYEAEQAAKKKQQDS